MYDVIHICCNHIFCIQNIPLHDDIQRMSQIQPNVDTIQIYANTSKQYT